MLIFAQTSSKYNNIISHAEIAQSTELSQHVKQCDYAGHSKDFMS